MRGRCGGFGSRRVRGRSCGGTRLLPRRNPTCRSGRSDFGAWLIAPAFLGRAADELHLHALTLGTLFVWRSGADHRHPQQQHEEQQVQQRADQCRGPAHPALVARRSVPVLPEQTAQRLPQRQLRRLAWPAGQRTRQQHRNYFAGMQRPRQRPQRAQPQRPAIRQARGLLKDGAGLLAGQQQIDELLGPGQRHASAIRRRCRAECTARGRCRGRSRRARRSRPARGPSGSFRCPA